MQNPVMSIAVSCLLTIYHLFSITTSYLMLPPHRATDSPCPRVLPQEVERMASQQTLPRRTPPSQDTWPFVYATRPSAAPPGVLAATGQTSGKWLPLFMVGHVCEL